MCHTKNLGERIKRKGQRMSTVGFKGNESTLAEVKFLYWIVSVLSFLYVLLLLLSLHLFKHRETGEVNTGRNIVQVRECGSLHSRVLYAFPGSI